MSLAVRAKPRARRKPKDPERRMELTEHLAELRSRIIRSILYVIGGAVVAYLLFDRIYGFVSAPLFRAAGELKMSIQLRFDHFTEPFMLVLQICIVAGLIMVSPLVLAEAWGFVGPALKPHEKRPLKWIFPFSVVLFFSGCALAYWVSTFAINWFLGYVEWFRGAVLLQNPKQFAVFMLKIMAIFGAVFQLPIFLMFLAWVGILNSRIMRATWRHAVVAISVLGLFITPSNDALTMLMMIVPVCALYFGSIVLVMIIERRRGKRQAAASRS